MGTRMAVVSAVVLSMSLAAATAFAGPSENDDSKLLASVQAKATDALAGQAEDFNGADPARLAISSNFDCELFVNGKRRGAVNAGSVRRLSLVAGTQVVECRSESGAFAESTASVEPGAEATIVLTMQRFAAVGAGIVVDHETGRQWTQSDNGSSIDWLGAVRHCEDLPGGWRLPTAIELRALVGKYGHGIDAMKPFRLTGPWAWTDETIGSNGAFLVSLHSGRRDVAERPPGNARAVCVR